MPRSKNPAPRKVPQSGGSRSIDLSPLRVRPGASEVLVTIAPPQGHVFNTSVPFELHANTSGAGVEIDPAPHHFVAIEPRFPHAIPARFHRGEGRLDLDVVAYYCEETQEHLCFYQHVHLNLRIAIDEGAVQDRISVAYQLGLPEDPST